MKISIHFDTLCVYIFRRSKDDEEKKKEREREREKESQCFKKHQSIQSRKRDIEQQTNN